MISYRTISVIFAGLGLSACSSKEHKIGEKLLVLPSSMEMTDNKDPDIEQFFESQIFSKKEGNSIKWKLVLAPVPGYSTTLSEELIKCESATTPSNFSLDRNAVFFIEFLDVDGFVIHEARAGDKTVINFQSSVDSSKNDVGSKPILSKDSYLGEVCYFGEIQSQSDQIGKIDKVRIKCKISERLKSIFVSLINYKKEDKKGKN